MLWDPPSLLFNWNRAGLQIGYFNRLWEEGCFRSEGWVVSRQLPYPTDECISPLPTVVTTRKHEERRNRTRNTDVKWWVSGHACGGRLVLGRLVGVRVCVYSFPDPTWLETAECSPQVRNWYRMRLARHGRKLCSEHSCQQSFAVINVPCCF